MLIVKFKDYVVEIDRLNHTLIEETVKNDGKIRRKYLGYFSNMESVIKHLIINEHGKNNDVLELKEYLKHYRELNEEILEDVKNAKIEYKEQYIKLKNRKKAGSSSE